MGQALYRKYRSKSLDEVVGQEHITRTLSNALKKGSLSHAYLFTGPKGVGKTSIARILAHEANGLPYTNDDSYLDIIEIDAASNRRIDEIRDLRDKIHIAPTQAKYKVYIIDEVHMLTKEAFNALLKTLEEPPAHVIFILATTESHKVPETIQSRTQRFSFRPIAPQKVIEHLRSIAKREKLDVSDDALALIAEHGGGSFRDSISMLDQLGGMNQKIELQDVETLLGVAPEILVEQLSKAIVSAQTAEVLRALENLKTEGYTATSIAKTLSGNIRTLLISKRVDQQSTLLNLLKELLEVPASMDPFAQLEIACVGCSLNRSTKQVENSQKPIESKKVAKPKPIESKKESSLPAESTQIIEDIKETEIIADAPEPEISKQDDHEIDDIIASWSKVLDQLKGKHNTLYGVVRMAEPSANNKQVTLRFRFPFHYKQMSQSKHKQIVIEAIQTATGQRVMLECILETSSPADISPPQPEVAQPTPRFEQPTAKKSSQNDDIQSITNIFGGGELLES